MEHFFQAFDPAFDAVGGNKTSSSDSAVSTDMATNIARLNAGYKMGAWSINLIGAYARLRVDEVTDLDQSPAPLLLADPRNDDHRQKNAELRLQSPFLDVPLDLGDVSFVLGLFYEHNDLRTLDSNKLYELPMLQYILSEAVPGLEIPGLYPIPYTFENLPLTTEETSLAFDQESHSVALFMQANWRIADNWTIKPGARFGRDRKSGYWDRQIPTLAPLLRTTLGFRQFTANETIEANFFTPSVAVQYNLAEDANLYASWASGFKDGGFNAWMTPNADPAGLSYKPEKVYSWELGSKSMSFNRKLRVDVALFWMDLRNYQVVVADSNNFVQSVRNAKKVRSRGLELNSLWLPTTWSSLRIDLGLDDAKYVDFKSGDCAPDHPNADGDSNPYCDRSGDQLIRTPRFSVTVTPGVQFNIGETLIVSGLLTIEHESEKYVSRFHENRGIQPDYTRLGARIGIASKTQGWRFDLFGTNLNNVDVKMRYDDAPMSAFAGGDGAYWQVLEPPREIYGKLSWSF